MRFIHASHVLLLLAGLTAAWAVYRMPADGEIPEAAGASSSRETTADNRVAWPHAASNDIAGGAAGRHEEGGTYSAVRNLIGNLDGRVRFRFYRLTGIIADPLHPESGRALIEDLETGTPRPYALHDRLPDHSRLAAITNDYVVLEKDGVRKRLPLHSRTGAGNNMDAAGTAGMEGYEKIGEHEFDLNPYRVFTSDADRILDFSLEASVRGGAMEGIRISRLEPGRPAHLLGLRAGDVLLEVNGRPVDSLLKGVRACLNAHRSDDVEIRLRREGRPVTLTYHLFWKGRGSWTPSTVLRSRAVASLLDDAALSHLF